MLAELFLQLLCEYKASAFLTFYTPMNCLSFPVMGFCVGPGDSYPNPSFLLSHSFSSPRLHTGTGLFCCDVIVICWLGSQCYPIDTILFTASHEAHCTCVKHESIIFNAKGWNVYASVSAASMHMVLGLISAFIRWPNFPCSQTH